jgi:hypothetical protein
VSQINHPAPASGSFSSLTPFIDALYADGITALQGAFSRDWVEQLRQDMMAAWVLGMCEAVLGPSCEIVEIGFDVPFEGAQYPPWHRDFHDALPPLVREHLICRVVDSLVPIAQKHGIEGLVMAGER